MVSIAGGTVTYDFTMILAPLFCACSNSSSIKNPAPSPMTKPSLSLSKGMEARSCPCWWMSPSCFEARKANRCKGCLRTAAENGIGISVLDASVRFADAVSSCSACGHQSQTAGFGTHLDSQILQSYLKSPWEPTEQIPASSYLFPPPW